MSAPRDAKLRAFGARWIDTSLGVWFGLWVLFFAARAAGLVTTSWWIVFFPLWAPAFLFIVPRFIRNLLTSR